MMAIARIWAVSLCLALAVLPASLLPAWAGETLSGVYHGSITVRPKDAVVPYEDRNATIKIVDQSGEPVAVVTYSAHTGRWREVCTITYNPDDTVTLTGTSYTVLSGSDSFNPDTFTIRIAPDGSLSGGSVDSEGGTTVLAMHH
jgi:hypothetical protein